MILLTAMLVLSQDPASTRPVQGPEAVRAAFVQGVLNTASEAARACVATEPKVCQPMLKSLAQYTALAKSLGTLTVVQAQLLLDLDRELSPGMPGEVTRRVLDRFVVAPLQLAHYHEQNGNLEGAKVIALQVLEADPGNSEAKRLVAIVVASGPL
jgi:hypothetical protein